MRRFTDPELAIPLAEAKMLDGYGANVTALLELAERYADTDGAHHKQWVIDQMIRLLLQDDYRIWRAAEDQERRAQDRPLWNEGVAP